MDEPRDTGLRDAFGVIAGAIVFLLLWDYWRFRWGWDPAEAAEQIANDAADG